MRRRGAPPVLRRRRSVHKLSESVADYSFTVGGRFKSQSMTSPGSGESPLRLGTSSWAAAGGGGAWRGAALSFLGAGGLCVTRGFFPPRGATARVGDPCGARSSEGGEATALAASSVFSGATDAGGRASFGDSGGVRSFEGGETTTLLAASDFSGATGAGGRAWLGRGCGAGTAASSGTRRDENIHREAATIKSSATPIRTSFQRSHEPSATSSCSSSTSDSLAGWTRLTRPALA